MARRDLSLLRELGKSNGFIHALRSEHGQWRQTGIVLEECGVEYDIEQISLVEGEQLTPEFLKRSPYGRIPVLLDNSINPPLAIYGSEPIAIHLAETAGKFLPADPSERAKVFEVCSVINGDLAAAMSMPFLINYYVPGDNTKVDAFCEGIARRFYTVLDQLAKQNGFLATSQYSIADMLAFPAVHMSAARIEGILDGLDALNSWKEKMLERPAVQRALGRDLG